MEIIKEEGFLGAFAKLRKSTVIAWSCVSVLVEQLRYHWTDFHYILYLSIFRKCVKKN